MKARTPLARWIAVGLAWFTLFGGALPARAEASPAEQEIGCVVPLALRHAQRERQRVPSTGWTAVRAAASRRGLQAQPPRSADRERPPWRGAPLFLSHRALLR